ncbi:MAG TPA: hypothetical protein VF194_04925 [Ferrovibrio sp.]|uniref:hypothetical protein n=1 Tax=Ferrovibrio sp. TaxID=1917215 RepID=UPI002ED43995
MNLLNLRTNSAVNLDGVSYRVRSCRPVADFSVITLARKDGREVVFPDSKLLDMYLVGRLAIAAMPNPANCNGPAA